MKKSSLFIQIGLIIAILLVLNLLSESLYFRLDFTGDNRYTLSDATKEIVSDLDEVITIKAYFTEELPPQLAYVRNDLRDQLVEYENRSQGNIVFEFISPNESDELKQEALQNGIAPVSINVVENDQRQQLQAFMGLLFQAGDDKEVIPIIQPGAAMEYDLTTAIKKLAITDKPKIGLIQGHGEPTMQELPQLMEQLSVLYDVEPISLSDSLRIPAYYRSLIWLRPIDTVSAIDFAKLDQYLNQGGNVFLAHANVQGDLSTAMLAAGNDIGISSWVGSMGLQMGAQFVIDSKCASVTVQQRSGFFTINNQVQFPYFPQLNNFENHPVTGGLEAIMLPFASPLSIINTDTSRIITPLIYSSELSGIQSPPIRIDINKRWTERDFAAPEQILAASVEGIGGLGKLVVVTNGQFVINGAGQTMQQLNADNVNFASNAVDWLSDDTGLIELRTKAITNRPLESVEDTSKELLKYGNVFAPILIILIYGFIRRSNLARKRTKWAQGNY
ncbi:MAG: GldG family protein [Cyclobacteriaceae bacterium]